MTQYVARYCRKPNELTLKQAVPLIQNLPEFQAIDDEDGRRAAFAKFVKRQKVRFLDV
jgi:pre-mRNA-processing factor 40